MKLYSLRCFQVICKHNNITRASEELHVSQPSLSSIINDLENEFGVTLFYRLRKGLKITPEGERLLELSNELTAQADALIYEMKALGNQNHTVKVGVGPIEGSIVFPRIFQALRETYPDTKLEIQETGSKLSASMAMDGTLDAAMITYNDDVPGNFNFIDVRDLNILFYTSIENPLAYMTTFDYEAFKDAPLVLLNEQTFLNSFVENEYKRHGLTPNCILHTNQLYTIRKLLDENTASTFLFEGILNSREENIVAIPLPENYTAKSCLIWHKNHVPSTGLSNLIRILKSGLIKF